MTQGTPARTADSKPWSSARRRMPRVRATSVEMGVEPSPGKCFGHAAAFAAASPRANESANAGSAKCLGPSGPSRESSTGARSTWAPTLRSAAPVACPAANASPALRYDEAASRGGRPGNALVAPPSWSTKTSDPAGRGRCRFDRETRTLRAPGGAGSAETTSRAAFSRGVRPGVLDAAGIRSGIGRTPPPRPTTRTVRS